MNASRSIAELSLSLTGMFEAELLTQLMLREWKHPDAGDDDFRNGLLEAAAEILRSSCAGTRVVEEISPANMNLVAALYIAEATTLNDNATISNDHRVARRAWLEGVRRSVPSCFCDPDLLQ